MSEDVKIFKEIEYWNNYYNGDKAPQKPSSFAMYCLSSIDKEKSLVEFGCGNGRDSFFFEKNGVDVIAFDSSDITIANNKSNNDSNVRFIKQDFTAVPGDLLKSDIGTVYSRFTLHSVNKERFKEALQSAYDLLDDGGNFLIEARTVNDPICGVGTPCPDNGYINTHYRRFLEIKEVLSDLESIGFSIIHAVEDYTSSWYKDDHAVVLRIFAKKG